MLPALTILLASVAIGPIAGCAEKREGTRIGGHVAVPTQPTGENAKPGINDPFKGDIDVAEWIERFERESREIYQHRDKIASALGLRPGMIVADIGAGTGFFSIMFADRMGGRGRVYAVDIAQEFLDHIEAEAERRHLKNIVTVRNSDQSVGLPPESIDLAFICDTYHHFEQYREMMRSIHAALRPNGEVVVIDFFRDEEEIAHLKPDRQEWLRDHVRGGKARTIREIGEAGFELAAEQPETPWLTENYMLRFRKVD